MGKRDILIARYADDLRDIFGIEPDPRLLERVTINCGPAIYDPEQERLDPGNAIELARLRRNFLVRKLGILDERQCDAAIEAVIGTYAASGAPIRRAVVHYMLVLQFEREHLFA